MGQEFRRGSGISGKIVYPCSSIFGKYYRMCGAHGGLVGRGTALQAGSIPDGVAGIFHLT